MLRGITLVINYQIANIESNAHIDRKDLAMTYQTNIYPVH